MLREMTKERFKEVMMKRQMEKYEGKPLSHLYESYEKHKERIEELKKIKEKGNEND